MQKKKILIIMLMIILILWMLIVISNNVIKIQNNKKFRLSENIEENPITVQANSPKLSAGMIPVKYENDYWTITTKEDEEWYNYEMGKPAYVMLNDGVYQSEIIQNMEKEGYKLASENIGVQIKESDLGTIFVWIPRFALNDNEQDIQYVQDVQNIEEGWTIPELFMYKQSKETTPDFLLTGCWVEKQADTSYSSKILEMSKEYGIYGFLAHTKAEEMTETEINTVKIYSKNIGIEMEEIGDLNRIVLKIIYDKDQNPIKANAVYSKSTGIITVKIMYSQYGIEKILLNEITELEFEKVDGIIIAYTHKIEVKDEDQIINITIVDRHNNEKKFKIEVMGKIYATLYTDGTLAIGKSNNSISDKIIEIQYGDISEKDFTNYNSSVWYNNRESIKVVDFVNKISPTSTAFWFSDCKNLIEIKNIKNLITSNVTNMRGMFRGCSSLINIDLSNFNTINVTSMGAMFYGCNKLTKLDVSSFNTSQVINMVGMFRSCSSLISIDLSNFNTSNVISMNTMFCDCSSLTSIDLSNFDTSNVTDIGSMLEGCSSLTDIYLSNFDTSQVTNMSGMFAYCSSLTSIDLSNFDTSKVTDMSSMFTYCSNLTSINISAFDTSQVTNMSRMFTSCSNLTSIDLSSFDTRNVTDMGYMFKNCSKLSKIYVSSKWTMAKVTNRMDMFVSCGTSSVTKK